MGLVDRSSVTVADEFTWLVVGTCLVTLVVDVASGWLGGMALAYAIAIPLGIVLGLPAVLGVVVAGLIENAITASTPVHMVTRAVADVIFVGGGIVLWHGRDRPQIADGTLAVAGAVGRFVLVATLVGMLSASVHATALALFGSYSFTLQVPALLVDRLLPAVSLGPLFLLAAPSSLGRGHEQHLPAVGPGRLVVACGVASLWVSGGIVLSLVRQDILAFPAIRDSIANYVPAVIFPVVRAAVGEFYWLALGGSLLCLFLLIGVFLFPGLWPGYARLFPGDPPA